jgi:hypothetical protein
VTVSEQQRRGLLAVAPELGTSTVALPNCVPEQPPAGPVPEQPVVLAGGRLSRQKGFDTLLDAWSLVRSRRPDARLVLVGSGEDEALLHEQCRRLGLHDVVRFVGEQPPDEVRRLLDGSRFFVMPSRFEGMPYFALEAAMAGRAVLGTAVGGLDEVVVDGETGVLVPPEQPEPLAEAIVGLLDDPAHVAELAGAARARVLRQHGLATSVDALRAVYERAASPARRSGVVSVVIPAWRAERWVGEAVRSALHQRLPDGIDEVECIVVDDASPDGSLEAAQAVDPSVTVVRQCKSGAGGARNTGLALATGEHVAFLDADDRWPSDRTAVLHDAMRAADADAAFGSAQEFGGGVGVAARATPMSARVPNTALFRRDLVDEVGGFVTGTNGEVVEWMARVHDLDPPVVQVPQVTVERRVHGDNTGRGVAAQRNRLAALKRTLDRRRSSAEGAEGADVPDRAPGSST